MRTLAELDKLREQDHLDAMASPRSLAEKAHVALYKAVKAMAAAGWFEDGYADDYAVCIARDARALLSMESGQLDCGRLDAFYLAADERVGK